MNTIQPWNPFKEIETMQKSFADFFAGNNRITPKYSSEMYWPAIDITEDKENFYFKLDLPDMKKEDIKVEFNDGIITISGQKKSENESKNDEKKFHRIERSYGSFMRSFSLPSYADASRVNAEYNNGVLDVKIAKKQMPSTDSKTIPVK